MKNGVKNDNNNSIRLIDDECNIYTMAIAKIVRRATDKKTDLMR
jgi:hypothetical protein